MHIRPWPPGSACPGRNSFGTRCPRWYFGLVGYRSCPTVLRGPRNWPDGLPRSCRGNAWILANHGAVSVGASLDEAQIRMETLEHGAKIVFTARLLGRVNPLAKDEVRRLENLRRNRDFLDAASPSSGPEPGKES